jgi:hypothetical protein
MYLNLSVLHNICAAPEALVLLQPVLFMGVSTSVYSSLCGTTTCLPVYKSFCAALGPCLFTIKCSWRCMTLKFVWVCFALF